MIDRNFSLTLLFFLWNVSITCECKNCSWYNLKELIIFVFYLVEFLHSHPITLNAHTLVCWEGFTYIFYFLLPGFCYITQNLVCGRSDTCFGSGGRGWGRGRGVDILKFCHSIEYCTDKKKFKPGLDVSELLNLTFYNNPSKPKYMLASKPKRY